MAMPISSTAKTALKNVLDDDLNHERVPDLHLPCSYSGYKCWSGDQVRNCRHTKKNSYPR